MMRWKWLCTALVLVLLLSILPLTGASTPTVYQLALNDKFVDEDGLVASNMPVAVGGTIYVPYSTFDRYATGVDLDISYTDSRENGSYILILYSLNGSLSFNVDEQTCVDQNGAVQNMQAIIRNGKVYVPAYSVCRFFGLEYSYIPTQSAGVLIRIKNRDAVLSDVTFQQSAASFMQNRYNRYLQSLTASTPAPTPTPRPTPTPAPTTSGGTEEPEETPEETDGPTVRLAFACTTGEALDRVLDTLESRGAQALLLFRPEDLESRGADVLRALGEGHTVGLLVDGSSLEGARQALTEGNEALRRLCWTRTYIACLEDAGSGVASALAEEGWRLWSGNVDGRGSSAERILARAQSRGNARVTLDDSGDTAGLLSRFLTRLDQENGLLRPVLEGDLD